MKTARLLRFLSILTLLVVGLGALPALARPGGGNTFRAPSTPATPTRSFSPSTPSRPSTPSWPSSPSTPSRPSTPVTPTYPSSPSDPSYPSYPSGGTPYSYGDHSSIFSLFLGSPAGIMILLAIAGVILFNIVRYRQNQALSEAWAAGDRLQATEPEPPPIPAEGPRSMRAYLEKLRAIDPDFSLVLFEDFLYSLYAKVHEARGRHALDGLAGYVSRAARRGLVESSSLAEIKAIVVASFEITGVIGLKKRDATHVRVAVAFTANYTEVDRDGTEQSYWVAEAWEVMRRRDAVSHPPSHVRTFGCPSCGAPLDALQGNVCSYCKKDVESGDFDWIVVAVNPTQREPRGPQLTGETIEQGSDLDTIIDPEAKSRLEDLSRRDPEFAFTAFQSRIEIIFAELQIAWSTRDWKRARPFVSDALFQSQLYWMTTYRKQKLRNVTERSRIVGVQMAKITADKFFDAVTVRVFASGLDYTVSDETDAIVAGSRTRERYYTEYWTLIRGSSRTGKARTDLVCPNCGAPLAISMAGSCEHCNAKVTAGEFDWVLSRIEQDESYAG